MGERIITTVIGKLKLIVDDHAIQCINWYNSSCSDFLCPPPEDTAMTQLLNQAEDQLQQYLAGQRRNFELPLAPQGTLFQQRVWDALSAIPYGETRSYHQIAQQIENPKAIRAVGAANRCNPLPIIVPCHRVIGANGTLTGFTGGLAIKRYLLELEKNSSLSN